MGMWFKRSMRMSVNVIIQGNMHVKVRRQAVFPHQERFVHHRFGKRENLVVDHRLHELGFVELVEMSMAV